MSPSNLEHRLRDLAKENIPLPGQGATRERLERLFEVGREDLSLAKLIEAHWDALAILADAGRQPRQGAIYGVWASEIPHRGLSLEQRADCLTLNGAKPFCSGLGIVNRALVTVTEPSHLLVDIDLAGQPDRFEIDLTGWKTETFRDTCTGAISFEGFQVTQSDIVGAENFYLNRPGFWQGACQPAACWIGGASQLVSYAKSSKRNDPHTLAHLGAMDATLWTLRGAIVDVASEIDALPLADAMMLALRFRHCVEQGCTDIIRRFARAYGPHPLAFDDEISRTYQALDLYLRQTHGERDLESLGRALINGQVI